MVQAPTSAINVVNRAIGVQVRLFPSLFGRYTSDEIIQIVHRMAVVVVIRRNLTRPVQHLESAEGVALQREELASVEEVLRSPSSAPLMNIELNTTFNFRIIHDFNLHDSNQISATGARFTRSAQTQAFRPSDAGHRIAIFFQDDILKAATRRAK